MILKLLTSIYYIYFQPVLILYKKLINNHIQNPQQLKRQVLL